MDFSRKRKTGGSSSQSTTDVGDNVVAPAPALSPQVARKMLGHLSKEQLVDVLQTVVVRDDVVLDAVRSIADSNPTFRKLFIRSIGSETTTDKLRLIFSSFGELEEAVVVTDKASGKSKGYGFVIFKHIDGAILALKEPNKKIDGRITVVQLASVRDSDSPDVWKRKVFIRNIPFEISPERLLDYFSAYGEIEEGPLGFDKLSGKEMDFAFFIYKTVEGANGCLVNPTKIIDGHKIMCKLAKDGRKEKVGGSQGPTGMPGNAVPLRESMSGGPATFRGFDSGPPLQSHQNPEPSYSMPSSTGGSPGFGNQGPTFFGHGSDSVGGYAAVGYGGSGFGSARYYGGRVAYGEYPHLNDYGSSMNRLSPRFGGYPDVGNYGLSFASQVRLPSAGPRGPLGGWFQGGPPFY